MFRTLEAKTNEFFITDKVFEQSDWTINFLNK